MNDQKKYDKYVLLNNLFNLFLDDNYRQEDDRLFQDWNIDIDGIVKENMNLFRQLRTVTQAELNQARHKKVYDFLAKLQQGIKSKIANYEKIAEEITSRPQFTELTVLFRNLENISEKDKESILSDAKLLEILVSFEEEFNEKFNDEQTNNNS